MAIESVLVRSKLSRVWALKGVCVCVMVDCLLKCASRLLVLQVAALNECKAEVTALCETHHCNPILVRLAWHDAGERRRCGVR